MYLLVDAYNVLKFKYQKSHITDQERTSFLSLLNSQKLRKKDKIMVIFDGGDYWRTEEEVGKLTLIFSGAINSADDEIVMLANKYRNCLVVTNDNELKKEVSGHGVILIPVITFLACLRSSKKETSSKLSNSKNSVPLKISTEENYELDQLMLDSKFPNLDYKHAKEVDSLDLVNELIKKL